MSSNQKVAAGTKIVPHLWFVDNAVEAANKKFDIARPEQAYAASKTSNGSQRSESANMSI